MFGFQLFPQLSVCSLSDRQLCVLGKSTLYTDITHTVVDSIYNVTHVCSYHVQIRRRGTCKVPWYTLQGAMGNSSTIRQLAVMSTARYSFMHLPCVFTAEWTMSEPRHYWLVTLSIRHTWYSFDEPNGLHGPRTHGIVVGSWQRKPRANHSAITTWQRMCVPCIGSMVVYTWDYSKGSTWVKNEVWHGHFKSCRIRHETW